MTQDSMLNDEITTRSRFRVVSPRAFAVALLVLAIGILDHAVVRADGLSRFVGAVRKIADDGDWEVKGVKGLKGKWKVRIGKDAKIYGYRTVPFEKIDGGETVHVLGRFVKEQPGSGGGTNPPQMIGVQVIFSGAGFKPPKITPDQKKASMEWRKGKLRKPKNEFNYYLGPIKLQANKNTEVVHGRKLDRADVKKGSILLLAGLPDEEKKKPKGFLANAVRVLDGKTYKSGAWVKLFPLR